jgi:hypothetical protein
LKRALFVFALAALFLSEVVAQTAPQPTQPPSSNSQKQAESSPSPLETAPRKITSAEAQELFKSVDEILKFVSERTGLPIKSPVKRELTSREQLEKYINQRMAEDEDAQRLKRSGIVLKKFGLLPADFNIETYIVQLYREQVAGYYDPKTKTIYLLDWVDPDLQKAVLAHELTHALQDQGFDLMTWADWGNKRRSTKKSLTEEVADDEDRAGRQSLMEGQAMVMLMEYTLAPMGRTLEDSPMIVDALKAGMLDAPDSPVFSAAPLYLREALTFPYRYGLDFTRVVLEKRGKQFAFKTAFGNPPRDTREVMMPDVYLAGAHVSPIPVIDFSSSLGGDYERYDLGSIGQFDTMVMLKTYASEKVSASLSPQWRGGYYYAAQKKGAHTDDIALVYVSRWADQASVQQFAKIYADGLTKRYKSVKPVYAKGNAVSMTPERWDTESGSIWIKQRGVDVTVVESVPETIAAKILAQ